MDEPPTTSGGRIVLGPFTFDPADGRLWRDARVIPLRRKAVDVLRYLVARRGVVVRNEELLDAVWPDVNVTPQTLTNVIRELRVALDDPARAPRFLQTLHRQGHVLLADPTGTANTASGAGIMVGRAAEMERVQALWRDALAGRSRLAFVTGEPGIGKTTLVETALRVLPNGSATPYVARGTCVEQHGQDEAYVPVLDAIEDLLSGPHADDVMTTLRRCAPTWLVQLPWRLSTTDHRLLEQSLIGTTAARMLREGLALLRELGATRPLVLVLEDLHWTDLATLDLVAALGRRPLAAPVLVLATYREIDAAVLAHPLVDVARDLRRSGAAAELALAPFDEPAVQAYLEARFVAGSFPARLMTRLVEHSAGNPLFLGALIDRLVARDAIVKTADGWRLAGEPDAVLLELPQSLRDFIHAEIDAMPLAIRDVIESASVAGLDFTAPEVAAALAEPVDAVERACEGLTRVGRLVRSAGEVEYPDHGTVRRYVFVHAAHRQIVYERIAPLRRQTLHRATAAGLEASSHARLDTVAARLATHYERGGVPAKAIDYFERAATYAERRFAYRESAAYLRAAIGHLDADPAAARSDRAAWLWLRLGGLQALVAGFSTPETENAFERVRTILADGDPTPALFMAEMALCRLRLARGEVAKGRTHGDRLLELARARMPELTVVACCWAGYAASSFGDLAAARALLEKGAAAPPATGLNRDHDMHRIIDSQLALVLTAMGDLDVARARSDAALARSLAQRRAADLAFAYVQAAERAMFLRDREAARDAAAQAIAVGEESELQSFVVFARFYYAAADVRRSQADRLIAMREARAARHALGERWQDSILATLIAELQLEIGDLDGAARTLADATAFVAESQELHHEAELMRLQGELVAKRGGRDAAAEAAAWLRRAAARADEQGAALWKLRAAVALARLKLPSDARAEVRDGLVHALVAISGGEPCADVTAARRLLAENASGR